MRSGRKWGIRRIAATVLLACLCAGALAETGIEYDEDGGVWDWDQGIYTPKDGTPVAITRDDDPAGAESAPAADAVQNDDGSITIITNEEDSVQAGTPAAEAGIALNEDGSITVESGQIQIAEPEKKNEMTGDEAWALGMEKAAARNGDYTFTVYTDPDGRACEVQVVYMGLARSTVIVNGTERMVDTCCLAWDTEAPEDKQLAVVTTKSPARLYAKTSKKSLVMDRCTVGTVVRVLNTGKNWTFVDYNGIRGYVQTPSLEFYSNEPREYRAGWVATKSGHAYGDSMVHVRNTPTGKQQEEYRVGTPITIFEDDGKWCRIEVQGHYCYIKRDFVLYDDMSAAAMADDGM